MAKEDSACQDIPKQQLPEYYLQHQPLQPKLEIANYVEQQGGLVPRRFVSLQEALESKRPFFIRSEHPQDYYGVSGLLASRVIDDQRIARAITACQEGLGFDIDWRVVDSNRSNTRVLFDTENQLIARISEIPQVDFETGFARLNLDMIEFYAKHMGIDPEHFLADISYSYWEYIDGYNRTVVADSAIEDRFHVMTNRSNNKQKGDFVDCYCIVENGQIIYKGPSYAREFPEFLQRGVITATDTYQQIANLERFDPKRRPIIEMQGPIENPDINYFLQYHRGTEFRPSTFTLNRNASKGEIEATFCRGATAEKG
ncbi:hypothetical protein HYT02_05205 [Candidatus Gottesmanbacteria bacterium]|nr:hypothetical protein [Candidatus Gottesmanbacteria bacterium]